METEAKKPPFAAKFKKPKPINRSVEIILKFGTLAADMGCTKDQVFNFIKAGVFLQPKQLEFCGLARLCDLPDGPKAILSGGGRGSGKSNAVLAQIFCDDCQRVPGLKVLTLRKVGRANKEQIQDFRKKLLGNLPHNYREQASTITFDNGSLVVLGNFKDEKDIDKYLGLEYDLIYIMESNQLTQTKKVNILSCLRTNKTNWRPRCYQDTNPGGVDHVANKMIFVEPWKREMAGGAKQTETRYIHSTVDDNAFVDSGYKEYLEKLVGWQREAWLHGSWEFMAGAFFSNFHADIHVYPNPVTTLSERAVTRWFGGLDYGYSHPNAFVLCCEDEGGNIFVVAEYTASNTLIEEHAANIRDLCSLHGLDVGDLEFIAAGRDCFRVDKDGSTVATEYGERGIILTATHIDRVNAWSQVAEVFGDVQHQIKPRCFIHKNCVNLIGQIQCAQSDPKKPNDILKMNADSETGEGGDDVLEGCFVAGTMVTIPDGEIPIERIRRGQLVLTREGWKRVVACGMTNPNAKVFEAQFSHGRNLIGTGGHPIWTQRGWVRLDSLRNDDIVSVCLNQNLKLSYSTEENSAAIHSQNERTCETIISQVRLNRLGKAFRFTKRFTNTTTRLIKSLLDSMFITATEIRLITESKTLSACYALNTSKSTTVQNEKKDCEITRQQLDRLQPHGTTQKRLVKSRNKITPTRSENHSPSKNSNASFAERILRFIHRTISSNTAMSTARLRRSGESHTTSRKEYVSFAGSSFQPTSIRKIKPKLVPASVEGVFAVGRRPVFNLEVEDCPEYFAKGVLVHNCRNAIVMAYSSLLSHATPVKMGAYESASEAGGGTEYVDVEEVIREAEAVDMAGERM